MKARTVAFAKSRSRRPAKRPRDALFPSGRRRRTRLWRQRSLGAVAKIKNFEYKCSYTLMETMHVRYPVDRELTVSASIAVVFLSLAMARTARGRVAVLVALGAWFVLVLAIGATGALSPVRGGAPALGLTVVLPVAALVLAYLRCALCETTRWPQRRCRRSSLSMRSACSGTLSSFSTPRAAFPPRSRRARAGATFSLA